ITRRKNTIGNRFAWGSYMSPSCPSFPKPFEYIMIFAKDNIKLQTTGETDLTPKEFKKWAYSVWNIAPETKMKKIGHPACVDSNTECLTSKGWKKHNELKIGDTIASFNMKIGNIEWDKIKNITTYFHNGDAIKINGRHLDMILSPNHDSIIQKEYHTINKPKFRKRKADQLKKRDLIPCSAKWNIGNKKYSKTPSKELSGLLGWFLSEGYFIKNKKTGKIYNIYIDQSITTNLKKVKKIEKLLLSLNADYKKYTRNKKHTYNNNMSSEIATFSISKKIKNDILSLCGENRNIPEDVLMWNEESLKTFFFSMTDGDGHYRKTTKSFLFTQWKNKSYLDFMQAIGVRLGYDAYLSYSNKYVEFTHKKHKCLRNSKESLINKEKYIGIMWCPFVENNNSFVARRNGKIYISGNPDGEIIKWGVPFLEVDPEWIGWKPIYEPLTRQKEVYENVFIKVP
ncbi:hypothetical protein LCGC14_2635520, partial [marine sediment metagenome]